ncbi:GNAT family N-acetyltransferase [Clostridium sp. MSJ-8]|uniref:GNAT family N-acetyltransferase n=1 Tax=Clostridium sp. MSJ-8 TaxID=2841510 RepID=UPI00209DF276|nr:GNAT family N-acetyltransferase [Clostridium sp. MSJ-8]
MEIREATKNDIDSIEKIYENIHDEEEKGLTTIGWIRNIYPTRKNAEDGLERKDLFVMEDEGKIVATAVINQIQVDEYKYALGLNYAKEIFGSDKVSLGVFENNESAYYCYKATGFEDVYQDVIEKYTVMGEEWNCLELSIKL